MTAEDVIFIVIVTLLIVSLATTYIAIYLSLLFHYNFVAFCIISPFLTIILILLFVSYFRAACTEPGYTNPSINKNYSSAQIAIFKQNAQTHKQIKQQRRKTRAIDSVYLIHELKQTSYCDKCDTVKLPRVHHCKICQKCVIRMDHHCPWVGNCIGRYNNKYFILFLLYATLGLATVWISIFIDALMNWKYVSLAGDDLFIYLIGTVGVSSFGLFLSIGVLLISQLNILSQNLTTLQTFIPTIHSNVFLLILSLFSKKDTGNRIFNKFLENHGGYCLWILICFKGLKIKANLKKSAERHNKVQYR